MNSSKNISVLSVSSSVHLLTDSMTQFPEVSPKYFLCLGVYILDNLNYEEEAAKYGAQLTDISIHSVTLLIVLCMVWI